MKKILSILVFTLFGCSKPILELKTVNAADIHDQVMTHYQKEVVLINFWATWCSPCIEEFPMIVDLSNAFAEKGLKIYFISADWEDQKEAVIQFLYDHGVEGLSFLKEEGNDNQFIRDIHEDWTGALPYTIIYNKNGEVFDHWENKKTPEIFQNAIQKALAS
jgi:thiol-disulfide isomerase/thioredoxin